MTKRKLSQTVFGLGREYVLTVVARGVIKGYPDNTF
ncbi:MAG: S-layer homology domain-containing protein [Syntrophomonadaceae bacterium]|nr:S-layer homology domain-containing protein [Syntrophomonadaceae bacterium]